MEAIRVSLTAQQRLIAAVAGACAAALLAVRFLYIPLWGRLGEQHASLMALRVKIADARALMERLPAEEAALADATTRYQLLERRIGGEQSMARILEALGRQAKAHHLELATVQSRTEAHDERTVTLGQGMTLREVPLTLQLTGRYRQLGEFFSELPTAPYVAAIKRLRVTRPDAETPRLQADLTLAVYLEMVSQIPNSR